MPSLTAIKANGTAQKKSTIEPIIGRYVETSPRITAMAITRPPSTVGVILLLFIKMRVHNYNEHVLLSKIKLNGVIFMLKPRVGHINFLNVLPLTYSYQNGYDEGLSMTYEVPSVLNNYIKNDLLDISPISSIAYARQSENLLLLPDLCIRAICDVTSIVLISRKPIEQLKYDKIILSAMSQTSHCLLKIILAEGYQANPVYDIRHINTEEPIPDDASASLFIGDDALYMYLHTPENLYCYDLGKEWYKLTGHSMVYAVGAVRKDFAKKSPEVLKFAYNKIF